MWHRIVALKRQDELVSSQSPAPRHISSPAIKIEVVRAQIFYMASGDWTERRAQPFYVMVQADGPHVAWHVPAKGGVVGGLNIKQDVFALVAAVSGVLVLAVKFTQASMEMLPAAQVIKSPISFHGVTVDVLSLVNYHLGILYVFFLSFTNKLI